MVRTEVDRNVHTLYRYLLTHNTHYKNELTSKLLYIDRTNQVEEGNKSSKRKWQLLTPCILKSSGLETKILEIRSDF